MIRLNRSIFSYSFLRHKVRVFCRKYAIFLYILTTMFVCRCASIYFLYIINEDVPTEKSLHIVSLTPNISNGHLAAAFSYKNIESSLDEPIPKEGIAAENLFCENLGKDAQSAIRRAKTKECKEKISDISCQVHKGVFFPRRLKSFCSTSGYTAGRSVGCYIDSRDARILNGYSVVLKFNSPSLCSDICLQRGYIYAGVQYSKECFCGDDTLPLQYKTANKECDMPCAGHSSADVKCGGFLRMEIVQTGLGKQIPYAIQSHSAAETKHVRIAFILTVNGRALRQVTRLIRTLYHKDHYIFIHVDSSQQYLYSNLLKLEDRFSNIKISRRRYRSIWGGASLLTVLLHCMKSLLEQTDWHWDFAINLSESDFPIKTVSSLVEFLTANRERNFLKTHGQNTNTFFQKQGLDRTFLECETHMWRLGRRKLPLGIRFDGGSDWFCLNRKFIDYTVHSEDDLVSGLKKLFSYTLLPAESFFHTVLRNSEYCNTFTDNNLHMTNWNRKLGCRCQYKEIVDWCGCSPNDFTPNDWSKLLATETKHWYFGRKFEAIKNQEIINKVDQWLYGHFRSDTPSLNSYWENRYHYDDHPSEKTDAELTLYTTIMKTFCQSSFQTKLFHGSLYEDSKSCKLTPVKLMEVESYNHMDKYMGFLETFQATSLGGIEEEIQLYIKKRNHLQFNDRGTFSHSITDLQIGSKFDLKEQMFRNGEGALGEHDTVTIATWWRKDVDDDHQDPRHVHVYVEDPLGHFVDNGTLALDLDSKFQVLHHILPKTIKKRPGLWKVFIVHEKKLLASSRFAILPVLFLHGSVMTEEEAVKFENDLIAEYRVPNERHISESLEKLIHQTDLGQVKHIPMTISRQDLVERLLIEFYQVEDYCAVEPFSRCSDKKRVCDVTPWSSRFPDPKSKLTEISPTTGRIEEFYRYA